jgi:hypothetical protein
VIRQLKLIANALSAGFAITAIGTRRLGALAPKPSYSKNVVPLWG